MFVQHLFVVNAQLVSPFRISVLQFLFLFRLLLLYGVGLLSCQWSGVDVPSDGDVPFFFCLHHFWVIVHLFGLQVGIVVAGVPYSVAVSVNKCPKV